MLVIDPLQWPSALPPPPPAVTMIPPQSVRTVTNAQSLAPAAATAAATTPSLFVSAACGGAEQLSPALAAAPAAAAAPGSPAWTAKMAARSTPRLAACGRCVLGSAAWVVPPLSERTKHRQMRGSESQRRAFRAWRSLVVVVLTLGLAAI
ncbi:unnamed protein product, partial [Ectocarpus sp. 12 AP-2014]